MLMFKNLCGKCFAELFDSKSDLYLKSEMVCNHIPNLLKKNESTPKYSLDFFQNSILILTNPATLDYYCLLDEYEKEELLKFEKPILKVAIQNEELLQKVRNHCIKTKVIDTAPLAVLAYKLYEQKVPYFFIEQTEDDHEIFIHKHNTYFLTHSIFASHIEPVTQKRKFDLIRSYLEEFSLLEDKNLVICATNTNFLEFYLYDHEEMSRLIDFSNTPTKNILQTIGLSSGPKERLKDKFQNSFTLLAQAIEKETQKNSSIMEVLKLFLGSNMDDLATSFVGSGGLKLDMKIASNHFDLVSLCGSIMSYKLAGVEDKFIAFSFYESFADFILYITAEIKSKNEIQNIILCGDMLANQVLFSRLQKNGSHLNMKVSKNYPLNV